MNKNLIPEWAPTWRIQLVWPEEFYKKEENVDEIIDFYVSLVNSLTGNGNSVRIISPLKNRIDSIKEKFNDPFKPEVIYKPELAKISDIWIRDFTPFFFKTREYIAAVKTMYKPTYAYSSEEKRWSARNEEISYFLSDCRVDKAELNGYHIILDGGNLVHNGFGTGIVTNRVLSDNSSLFEHEIRDIFKERLGISELYIIPSEPGDDTGHIDGLVRFLDPNTLLVEQYPEEYPEGRIFTDKIAGYLEQQGFNVYRLQSAKPLPGKHKVSVKYFENATGNYLNFLRVGETIFLPRYDLQEDETVMQKLKDIPYEKSQYSKVIQVEEDATPLAEFGGVINCITSHLFETEPIFFQPFKQFIPVAKTGDTAIPESYFLAVRDSSKSSPEEYRNDEVIQVDFREGKTYHPSNLQKICKYLPVIPLDPDVDSSFNYTEHLMLFEPVELRKIWNIFQPEPKNKY